jgi:hypothetical protein
LVESLQVLADPAEVPDAYEAEVAVSVLIGIMVQAGARDKLLTSALLDVADELARGDPAYGFPALRTLAAVGPTETSGYAAQAADRVAAAAERAGETPAWLEALGRVTPGTCTIAHDVYGETQAVLCEFAYPDGSRPHGVFAVIDATWHGAVSRLVVTDNPAATRREMEKRARRDGELREIPAREAGALVQKGIGAFLSHTPPPGTDIEDEDYALLCSSLSLARRRAAALTGRDAEPPASDDLADRWRQDARQDLVSEFLASPHARDLQDPVSRKMPFLIVTTCVSQLGCDPQLVGPLLLQRMLLDVFPPTLIGPDRFSQAIPPVLCAWTRWLAERNGIPARQRRQLMFRLEYLLRLFPAAWRGDGASPLRRYVQDLPNEVACDGDVMFAIIERRTFAIPEPGSRGDGLAEADSGGPARHVDDLDAASETDRALITMIGLSERGVSRRRFDSYLAVAEQIWSDSPLEVWAAAQRMRAAGLSRVTILDRLARTWETAGGEDHAGYLTGLARQAGPRTTG